MLQSHFSQTGLHFLQRFSSSKDISTTPSLCKPKISCIRGLVAPTFPRDDAALNSDNHCSFCETGSVVCRIELESAGRSQATQSLQVCTRNCYGADSLFNDSTEQIIATTRKRDLNDCLLGFEKSLRVSVLGTLERNDSSCRCGFHLKRPCCAGGSPTNDYGLL